jgi:hypothetical protein
MNRPSTSADDHKELPIDDSELPDELRHKQGRLGRIRRAREELEAETAAELHRKAEAAAAKARTARNKAIKAAEIAGVEPPDLEPVVADAMPRRGLAQKAI